MTTTSTVAPALDLAAVRAQFPILRRTVGGQPLAYLDNAASTQKPEAVLAALDRCYRERYANIHRGAHTLSAEATADYEGARERVARHLGAGAEEIVFVRGTTEAVNLLAWSAVRPLLAPGDEILVTRMEHHSNLVPWQLLAEATGARVVAADVTAAGEVDLDHLESLLGPRTRAVAVGHVSNALGTVNPIAEIARRVRASGEALLLVDGAQAVPHLAVDVATLDCDAYAFSGHKAYGPTGIGVLWARPELLARMPPWQGGGDMIRRVSLEQGTTFAPPPARFEAGTPHIAGAIGLAAALDWMADLGHQALAAHERDLVERAAAALGDLPGVRLVGTAREKVGVVSFVVDGVHPHDVATILDGAGVAIRAGHHCAQPLMEHLGLVATSRASFAAFNTADEVDRLAAAVARAQEIFGR